MSRGTVYFCALRVRSSPGFEGDSGDDSEFDLESSAMRFWIIRSNFSTKRSLVSLACSIWRSRMESRGIRDRSIELTASYNDANVSGNGDRKYSSNANNNNG